MPVSNGTESITAGFFGQDGSMPNVVTRVRQVDGTVVQKSLVANPTSGSFESAPDPGSITPSLPSQLTPWAHIVEAALPPNISPGDGSLPDKRRAVWIDFGDDKRRLVTTDGSDASIAPGGDAVAYRHAGGLVLRRLVDVPLAAYRTGHAAEVKADCLALAKTAYFAVRDARTGSRLPTLAEWEEFCVRTHVSARVRSRFVYLGPTSGGTSEAVLGYVIGLEGRAVVRADGTAVWEKE